MQKVYVVTVGQYSDMVVHGVYATREAAEIIREAYDSHIGACIEEYVVNESKPEHPIWEMLKWPDGDTTIFIVNSSEEEHPLDEVFVYEPVSKWNITMRILTRARNRDVAEHKFREILNVHEALSKGV